MSVCEGPAAGLVFMGFSLPQVFLGSNGTVQSSSFQQDSMNRYGALSSQHKILKVREEPGFTVKERSLEGELVLLLSRDAERDPGFLGASASAGEGTRQGCGSAFLPGYSGSWEFPIYSAGLCIALQPSPTHLASAAVCAVYRTGVLLSCVFFSGSLSVKMGLFIAACPLGQYSLFQPVYEAREGGGCSVL